MKKKIIITEKQFTKITGLLTEMTNHARIVKELKTFLDANYSLSNNIIQKSGEYLDKTMIKINSSDELISPKQLIEYLLFKFGYKEEFIKQVVLDWSNNKITQDFTLSKPVTFN